MDERASIAGNYRIEVSGWGLDQSFFAEKGDLVWDRSGDKKVALRHALAEGAIVFIRLLLSEADNKTLPVAYQVAAVQPMDCNGWCEVLLTQLHPRTKVSLTDKDASYSLEDSRSTGEPKESSEQLETEEVLQ